MAEKKYSGDLPSLATWEQRDKSLRCPQCGKLKCYKEYFYADGKPVDPINHLCGKCDHTTHCGYHLPPKEFFAKHPEQRQHPSLAAEKVVKIKRLPMIEIPREMVKATMKQYEKNSFVRWLNTLPWTDDQKERLNLAIAQYLVGTTKDGSVMWWQIDENVKVRTGKKMLYNPETGKRMKDEQGNSIGFNWAHTMLSKIGAIDIDGKELRQTLFGMHLAANEVYKDCSLHIVESEKTAILMTAFDPESLTHKLWLATGGLYNLKIETLKPILKRELILYPDKNGVELWEKKMKEQGIKAQLSTKWIEATIPEDGEGADIADVCLRRMLMTDESRWQELLTKNEPIKMLAEALDLKLIK